MTSQQPISFSVTATPVEDIDELSVEWRELESRSAEYSFFLSWHWIGSWLRCLPTTVKPLILRVSNGAQTVGLAVLVEGTTPVLRIFSLRQIALNETGDRELDTITVEYNGVLAAAGLENVVTTAGLEWLLQDGVPNQAIQLGGIDTPLTENAIALASAHGRRTNQIRLSLAPYVDLAAIRGSGEEYLSHLSRNSRQSMRRCLRYYESTGPLEYHTATTPDEALFLLDELQEAHQLYWQSRGRPGSFARPFFKQFHTELIKAAFAGGHIEMARISAGGSPIGYLYNFVWRKMVYAYQSGFHYTDEGSAKPGYVSHYMAITYALARGRSLYDFMAGDRQHKTSLSTRERNLVWLQLRQPVLAVRLETAIKSLLAAIYNRSLQRPNKNES